MLVLDPTVRAYTIQSIAVTVEELHTYSSSVSIDDTLGRNTMFIVDYTGTNIDITVSSPNGTLYNQASLTATHNYLLKIIQIHIPNNEFLVINFIEL